MRMVFSVNVDPTSLSEILFYTQTPETEVLSEQFEEGKITVEEAVDGFNEFTSGMSAGGNVIPLLVKPAESFNTKEDPMP